MADKIPMTAEGLKNLRAKLEQLTNQARPSVEKRLGEAREMGDLSENAEFFSAREELWHLDRQIAEVQDQISRAEVVTTKQIDTNTIAFGAKVLVKDLDTGEEEKFTLVGEGESNLVENRIAITTPIGQGLLGHKVGDTVRINVPAGALNYEIVRIIY
ncbi:MAG: transcription elongation factor GreA [Planctomycetota bacterium]|nr:transcription elongation factor GreA [Planctomycetota bacterium]MDI6788361.1 transcription elongation factor GreA [Planctomycetota bacterium]